MRNVPTAQTRHITIILLRLIEGICINVETVMRDYLCGLTVMTMLSIVLRRRSLGPEMVSTDDGGNNCMCWLIEWPAKKSIKLF